MGSSSSICEVPGKCSYNFQSQRAQTSGGNLVAHEGTSPPEEAQSEQIQPSVISAKTAEGGEDTGLTNLKNSVSQSQCEVNVNAFSSLGFDSEVETSTNVGESKDVSNTLDIASLLPSKDTDFTRQELRVSYEDFKPGHATRVENTVEKYKQTAGHVKTAENDHLNALNQESDEEIQAVVVKCWRDIERTCESQHNLTCSQSIDSKRGWRVVRLFVSSTFADYHAEREILVKKVVPELREWCEDRSIHLIECDLRWGVPKDSTTEATIRTCLGEVDRCLEETDGQSFFLNMLGERYGWIPSPSEISQEIQEEYKWIFPTSITHMEITHAAYRTQSQNAAFLIRNDEFIKDLPPEMLMGFVDSHPLNKAHLKALKEKLRQRFPGQVFEYDCQYDGIDESSGRPKVKLKGLENFSEFVVEFFKSAINRSVPEVKENFSAEEMEILIHDHFIEQRGRLVLGRSTEISTLMEYLQHGNPNAEDTKTENIPPLMVLASPGSGKSALMAHCTLEIKKLGWPLFYHFVGAGPGSTIPHKLVQRLVQWLKGFRADVQPENLAAVEEMSMETLEKEINQGLEEIAKREEVFVIVIDAINQIADAEATSHMDWLPSVFPHNVRCLLSAVSDSRSVFLLSEQYRTPPPVPLHIGELNESARREIVKHTLGNYNKRLDAEQMSLMIGSSGACNPLWLSLACEELRVFGVFETITHHIKSFPATIKELLQLIINRLTNEDEHNNLPKVLGLLACSKGGLSETELQFLLSDDLAEPVPMMLWAKVRRTLKPFLRNVGGRGEERLEFFHASIHEVVLETILSDYEEKMKFHSKLADFFLEHCKDEDRVILMAPEQLKLAGDKKRLLEFLRKDPRSKNRPGFWKNSYYKYLRCNKALHVGSPFAHEIYICQFCATKRGVFGDTVQMSKDSCFICGRFTPWKDDRYVAMVCNAHRPPRGPPNMKMCFVCQSPRQNNVKAHLCPFCSTGGFKHCTMLVGE